MFSRMVMWGKRLNCWKTIPTSRRIASMLFGSSPSSTPSTTMRPDWMGSRRLMVRIRVLFPDPEGPMITSTSPGATSSSMSFKT